MRLAEAIAPHRLTTRQIDRLYQHYVGGPEVTRELVLTDPLLVLRLTDETTPARVRPDASPPEALITDFHVLGAVTRRAHRRLQHGGGLLPPERARAWRVFDQVQTRIRNLTFTPLKFVIEGPVAASLHPLEEEDSRKTKPIEFKVKSDAQTGVVTWSASREYTTRGGITATPNPVVQSFQTQPGASEIPTYEGEGGEVTVTATSTVNGAQLIAGHPSSTSSGCRFPIR